jgi:hypothetical protein
LTFLLFLKMADERKRLLGKPSSIPKDKDGNALDWPSLLACDGDALEVHYRHILTELGKQKGMLGSMGARGPKCDPLDRGHSGGEPRRARYHRPDRPVATEVLRMKRAALYMRVSTLDQHPETQLHDLRGMAAQRGFQIIEEYTDRISGVKARRPGLDQLLADARRGRFDVVTVWAFDRMANEFTMPACTVFNLSEANNTYTDLSTAAIFDTTTPLDVNA